MYMVFISAYDEFAETHHRHVQQEWEPLGFGGKALTKNIVYIGVVCIQAIDLENCMFYLLLQEELTNNSGI